MEDQHAHAAEVETPPLRQEARPAAVHVPAHGDDRRDLPELLQDVASADVARVEDHVGPPQRVDRLRPDEAVGVGDDADGQPRRHKAWPTRTRSPTTAAGASAGSARSSTTVEPRLKTPISSPRLTATGSAGTVRPAGPSAVRDEVGEGEAHPPHVGGADEDDRDGTVGCGVHEEGHPLVSGEQTRHRPHAGAVHGEQAPRHVAPGDDPAVHGRVDAVVHRGAQVERRVRAAAEGRRVLGGAEQGLDRVGRALDLLEPAVRRDGTDRAQPRVGRRNDDAVPARDRARSLA